MSLLFPKVLYNHDGNPQTIQLAALSNPEIMKIDISSSSLLQERERHRLTKEAREKSQKDYAHKTFERTC